MRPILTAIFLLFPWAVQANGFPFVGSYGFDWFKPTTSTCRRMTQRDAGNFKKCEFFGSGNAFGLPSAYYQCASERGEYLVYASRAKCLKAYETMQGNAP